MRKFKCSGTLKVSVSTSSNLNKEGVWFHIIMVRVKNVLESTGVAYCVYHNGQISEVHRVCMRCVRVCERVCDV